MSQVTRLGAGDDACSKISVGVLCVCICTTLSGFAASAHAEESAVPYLAGVNLGIPIAAAPPPGLYGSATNYLKPMTFYNGDGDKTPITVGINGTTISLFYVPGNQLLGGTYFAFMRQPVLFDSQTTDLFGESSTVRQNGIFNTIISPLNISWMLLPGHLFGATGMTFYIPDSTYSKSNALNIGNNFFTFEPAAAITFLNKGLNLTAFALYDINTANNSSTNVNAVNGNYDSGSVLTVEFDAIQTLGKFSVGAVGYVQDQLTNDTAGGQVVPAVSVGPYQISSRGDKVSEFAVGPEIGYDFGLVNVTAYFTRDLIHENTIGGDSFWLRLSTRF
jgi:hypothetical protein